MSHRLCILTNLRTINYSGSFTPGNALLSVYGWTVNPLIEYYITDSYATDPGTDASAGFTYMGSVDSDGGIYNIYTAPRENAGSVIGTGTLLNTGPSEPPPGSEEPLQPRTTSTPGHPME